MVLVKKTFQEGFQKPCGNELQSIEQSFSTFLEFLYMHIYQPSLHYLAGILQVLEKQFKKHVYP